MRKIPETVQKDDDRIRLGEISKELDIVSGRHAELKLKQTTTDEEKSEMTKALTKVKDLEKEWKQLTPSTGEAFTQGAVAAPNIELKIVYAQLRKNKDALVVSDKEGNQIELTRPQTEAAKYAENGVDNLYRKTVWPIFCKNGERLEVRAFQTERVIWKSY